MTVEKDKKGPCWVISHERDGYHEEIFVTEVELVDLFFTIKKILKENNTFMLYTIKQSKTFKQNMKKAKKSRNRS